MHCSGRGGMRRSTIIALVLICSLRSIATAQSPTNVVDPFVSPGVVPTPIVPYLSQTSESTLSSSAVPVPIPPAARPAPIGAGELVPITFPNEAPSAARLTEPKTVIVPPTRVEREPGVAELTTSMSPDVMVPVHSATITRDEKPVTTKNKKAKPTSAARPAATIEPSSKSDVRITPPPSTFTFPQPPIPLESALRRLFGIATGRR